MLGCISQLRHRGCIFLVILFCGPLAAAQLPDAGEPASPFVPLKPPTRKDIDRRDSLKHYVLGLVLERAEQMLEALKAYEEAARLDPDAPAVFRAQIPILVIMGRDKDSMTAINKVLELDPSDHETWFVAARMHKNLGNLPEARRALARGLDAAGLDKRPDMAQQMYLDLASMCESAGELREAVHALSQAAKILDHPDTLMEHGPFSREMILARAAETYERIGALEQKQKHYLEAIAAYKKAQAASPERGGRINFNLAQVLAEQGKSQDALTYLDTYLRLQPLELDAYEMKIGLLEKVNKQAAVIPFLEEASRADANNVGLKVFLAKQYARGKQHAQAEKLYKALANESPNQDIYRGLFQLYQEMPSAGMFVALNLLDKALEDANNAKGPPGLPAQQAKAMITALRDDGALAKGFVKAAFGDALRVQKLQFDTLHLLAVLADKHRQLQESEVFYRQALNGVTPGIEAVVYSGLLRVLWKEQKFNEVIKVCQSGVRKARATNQVLFYNEMAKAQARLGKMDEALRSVEIALQLAGDKDKFVIRHQRVRILVQGDSFEKAEQECQALLKEYTAPEEIIEVRYLLSNVYSASRQMLKAEEQLEMILKADPANATANNDLGYIWADQSKNLDKAEEMIRHAIDLDRRQRLMSRSPNADPDQDNAAYVDSLGWVLFRKGQLQEACRHLKAASSLPEGADDPTVWDHLGDVYFRLERYREARSAWEKSSRLFETENRRKMDERHQEVRNKLKALDNLQK